MKVAKQRAEDAALSSTMNCFKIIVKPSKESYDLIYLSNSAGE
jgi:hypothetical protein